MSKDAMLSPMPDYLVFGVIHQGQEQLPITYVALENVIKELKPDDLAIGLSPEFTVLSADSFKDRVICTDVSRRTFIFKDENNNIIKDPKGVKITKKFIENNKEELINLLTQYSLTFYNENSFMDIRHKLEIDHCLDAIKSGDISYNADKYNNFEKIFTTCFSKFVYDKRYKSVLNENENNSYLNEIYEKKDE